MSSTTIRVDSETHARLMELSKEKGATLTDTVRDAAEALRRQRFAALASSELDELRADPEAWADYLAESASTSVTDGLG